MSVLQKEKEKEKIHDQRLEEGKRKRENPRSKIGGKQEKEKILDQRSEERKREIYRKVI